MTRSAACDVDGAGRQRHAAPIRATSPRPMRNNQTRTVTKNARGDVIPVTDALEPTLLYLDPLGNLLSTTDAAATW